MESDWFVLEQGVRQGGCISGDLFNIYFALLDRCNRLATIIFYADDLVVITYHPWAVVATLQELAIISAALNITWNPDKCKVMQFDSKSTHHFRWLGKPLENVTKFVYLGWIIVRKRKNCDDEQALRQASRFYGAAHEIAQTFPFTRALPMDQHVSFAKCFGSLYAPEAYTSLSERALSKLRAAHRYLCMKAIGWNGVEMVETDGIHTYTHTSQT